MKVCGRHYVTGETITVSIRNGIIESLASGEDAPDLGGQDLWLAPGFCDLQLNGYGGHDFNLDVWGDAHEVTNEPYAIREMAACAGTALFYPTLTTNSHEALFLACVNLARTLDHDQDLSRSMPGLHLEGPYISAEDGPRGAHPIEHVRDPNWEEFCRFQDAAGGRIRICTLAPERPGALQFIERLVAAGVVAALGHTGAPPEIIRDAVRAGARLSTHLGNGAHSRIARHPNYIWEQLAHDQLYATVIADGHHLPAAVLKCFARAKGPERLALVSDAVALGGLPPGRYGRGRFEVLLTGKVVLADTPYLAGAGHLLDTGVSNLLRFTDLTLPQVIRSVTEIPARILGLEGRKGHLQVGYDADLTLFRLRSDGSFECRATVAGGHTTYDARQRASSAS